MTEYTEVLFEERKGNGGDLGIITLNRANVLNSLNHDMVLAMHQQLLRWQNDNNIKAVVIRAAEGRAFCAGGDLRLTYERMKSRDPIMTHFFRDEYQLNRLIHHYPKPYIALLDGITMGGGVGISIHGSHRVATDRLLFAMPETGIGFFPDVGGTYFLPRIQNHIGMYLGLSGARIACDDCVEIGIATHKVGQTALPDLINAIAERQFDADAKQTVSAVINEFSIATLPSRLREHANSIAECFGATSVKAIFDKIAQSNDILCQEAALAMQKKSPLSLMITLHALHLGNQMDFDRCMQQEFRLVTRFLLSHDFAEGIRAVIIDKDQSPKWQPSSLAEVKTDAVQAYFAPLEEELV